MKGLAITSKGIEETSSAEIKELINQDCKIEECCVIFDFKDFKDLCTLCYKAQSIDRVLYLIGSFEFNNFFKDFEKFIGKLDFEEWITMEEILRRVNELFGIQYQNERSLYPYLKTLVDAGMLEASMLGGKMRWRKKNLMQTINLHEEIENEVVANSQPLQ